jgi:multidrug efflux pump subunit AcrB
MNDTAVLIRQSRWLGRKKTSLCVCCALLALSVFIIASPGNARREGREASYTVVFRHYGIDAREMERTAAIPLEDALAAIPGARSVLSSSENGQARVFVRFDRDKPGQYEAVREAAQTVYQGLPSSAQRPEILSSGNSRIPLWSAAVLPREPGTAGAGLSLLLERTLKPKLESLEGAGEVEIYGAGLQEFLIALKPDRAAALGIDPRSIAAALGNNDVLLPGGSVKNNGREILLTVDGRYGDSRYGGSPGLAEALIPLGEGRVPRLEELAVVYEQERVPDTISRLNGQKTAVISVMGSAGAEPGKLSRRIKAVLEEAALPLELIVLSDRGAEETAAYRSLLIAALEGSLMVALTAFLLGLGKSSGQKTANLSAGMVCAFAVPGVCLVSAALLSLAGFPLDRLVLGGLSAGLGAAVDAAILCAGELRSCRNLDEARLTLGRLRPPLAAGSLTTAASLLPLGAVESMSGGITVVAWAIGLVNIVSLVLSLSLLPPLCLWGLDSKPARERGPEGGPLPRFFRPLIRRIIRLGCRFLAADLRFCARKPGRVLAAGILLSAAGVAAVIINGVDAGDAAPEDSVFAQVEFEGGLRAEETDRLLADYAAGFAGKQGIRNVQTGARTASGSVLFSFDPKTISVSEVRELARSRTIPGGFVFFPESSPGERIWEIKIKGDDDTRCRELAVRAAALCAPHPLVKEAVLNFKEGSGRLTLVPDRERFLESGLSFSRAAEIARWGVHGPVAYKKTDRRGETDVRVRGTGAGAPSREEVLGTLVAGDGETAPRLEDLMTIREGREPSSIRREDRRRVASFSIRTKAMDPRRVRGEIMEILGDFEKPPGYTLEFDPEQIRRAEALSGTALFFLWALVFCYMVIAAAHESLTIPLAALAVVPPSLAFPALCLGLGGAPLYPAAACAFVAVSGMAVNASVLSAGGLGLFLKSPGAGKSLLLYRGLRKIFPLLLATGGTTVAGALPFILLREGANTLIRTLSLVTALGVGASCLCSLCIIPALAVKRPKIFRGFTAPGRE